MLLCDTVLLRYDTSTVISEREHCETKTNEDMHFFFYLWD